jgi:hypothetical protein
MASFRLRIIRNMFNNGTEGGALLLPARRLLLRQIYDRSVISSAASSRRAPRTSDAI